MSQTRSSSMNLPGINVSLWVECKEEAMILKNKPVRDMESRM